MRVRGMVWGCMISCAAADGNRWFQCVQRGCQLLSEQLLRAKQQKGGEPHSQAV
jgi:hypothetical protein